MRWGTHPGLDTSPLLETIITIIHALIHIYRQPRVTSLPIGIFWEVGGNWKTRRKPTWTQREHVKDLTDNFVSTVSSGWNQEPWSSDVATHTRPLGQVFIEIKQERKYHSFEENGLFNQIHLVVKCAV